MKMVKYNLYSRNQNWKRGNWSSSKCWSRNWKNRNWGSYINGWAWICSRGWSAEITGSRIKR